VCVCISDGGVLLIDSVPTPIVMADNIFRDSTAAGSGGFIALHSTKGVPSLSVQDCTFSNGTAARSGGAFSSETAEVELISCTSTKTYGQSRDHNSKICPALWVPFPSFFAFSKPLCVCLVVAVFFSASFHFFCRSSIFALAFWVLFSLAHTLFTKPARMAVSSTDRA